MSLKESQSLASEAQDKIRQLEQALATHQTQLSTITSSKDQVNFMFWIYIISSQPY